MSARPSVRRSRLLATAVAVAATAAALAPTAASAADAPSGDPAAKPLVATLAQAPDQGPLTRSGDGADLTMTVTNNSDQAQPFHPSVAVTPVGSAPANWQWIDFSATAVSAPDTYGLRTWSGTNEFAGAVLPLNSMASTPFTVPAHTTYSWKVSFKLTAALPADDTAVNVALRNDLGDSTVSDPLNLPVTAPTGAFYQTFDGFSGTVRFQQPMETTLNLLNNGASTSTVHPTLRFGDGTRQSPATLALEVWGDGAWVTVPGTDNTWRLPPVPGGLASGASHQYRLRLSLVDFDRSSSSYFSDRLSLTSTTDRGPVENSVKYYLDLDGTPAG
ncbi:hypothetical protein [Kitasatospora cineracea]|uniref:Uncharacterized protein n=1 Tax=Kitasatospora cineracea TaxID=88074 RepID=A0A8G1UFS5_9ACTN|nr:hypothetical protein [Kitasatospora cineracea]ROR43141.1 hypothetical protein EDD39_1282 [Kitasatospora cineracea]